MHCMTVHLILITIVQQLLVYHFCLVFLNARKLDYVTPQKHDEYNFLFDELKANCGGHMGPLYKFMSFVSAFMLILLSITTQQVFEC